MASRVTPAQVAAAMAVAAATVPTETLATRVAEFLRDERLVSRWPAIAASFRRGQTSATITVSQPLGEAALASLTKKLGPVEVVVNPALLGGAVIRRGDVQVDASIAGKLRKLERLLVNPKP